MKYIEHLTKALKNRLLGSFYQATDSLLPTHYYQLHVIDMALEDISALAEKEPELAFKKIMALELPRGEHSPVIAALRSNTAALILSIVEKCKPGPGISEEMQMVLARLANYKGGQDVLFKMLCLLPPHIEEVAKENPSAALSQLAQPFVQAHKFEDSQARIALRPVWDRLLKHACENDPIEAEKILSFCLDYCVDASSRPIISLSRELSERWEKTLYDMREGNLAYAIRKAADISLNRGEPFSGAGVNVWGKLLRWVLNAGRLEEAKKFAETALENIGYAAVEDRQNREMGMLAGDAEVDLRRGEPLMAEANAILAQIKVSDGRLVLVTPPSPRGPNRIARLPRRRNLDRNAY